jgi:uracil-DNA glycosylase family 4
MIRAEEMGIGDVARWFFGAAERWPETFDPKDLGQLWGWSLDHVSETYTGENSIRALVHGLRAGLLKRERAAVNRCTACPLHQNRLPGRAVFDDGDLENDLFARWEGGRAPIATTSAEIMVIGEGPGAFEQRTGFPFVSYQGLAGASVCARECNNYSTCFNSESKFPQGTCKPELLRKALKEKGVHPDELEDSLIQIRTERADAPVFPIQTAGNRLDVVLFKAGLRREVWNARAGLQGKPTVAGNVYVCNAVKCRSCDGNGKDSTPNKTALDACHPWLEMQLYIIQPKVIVALGNAAITMATGLEEPKVLSRRGEIHPCPWMEIPVVLDVHPSFIIRQPDTEKQAEYTRLLLESFELAKQIVEGSVELPWEQEFEQAMAEREAAGCPICGNPRGEHTPGVDVSPFDGSEKDVLRCPTSYPMAVAASFDDEDEGTALMAETTALKQEIIDAAIGGDDSISPSAATFIPTEPEEDEEDYA